MYPQSIGHLFTVISSTHLVLDLGQDFPVAKQQVLLVANLNWGTTKVWQQNLVSSLDGNWNQFSGSDIGDTWAGGNHGTLVKFFLVFLRNVDTTGGLGGRLHSLHQDSVEQWLQTVNVFQERLFVLV